MLISEWIRKRECPALVAGILNATPDSFSDGNLYLHPAKAVYRASQMADEGASLLDIGAQSTRPGYTRIPWQEEWARLEPVLKVVRKRLSLPLSVDTFYHQVALRALDCGADIINDVSGLEEKQMARLLKNTGCQYILVCNKGGKPCDIGDFFTAKLKELEYQGVQKEKIILDPGIGFGKSYGDDLLTLRQLEDCKVQKHPLMVGLSGKRVVRAAPGVKLGSEELRCANIAAGVIACQNGADILRVHDVIGTVTALKTVFNLQEESNDGENYY